LPFFSADFFSLGRTNIALLNGPIRYKYARERLAGYLESLNAAGCPVNPALIINLPEISYNLAYERKGEHRDGDDIPRLRVFLSFRLRR
jgi:DNA-binding LacI/PurR family transcriptional regulator